MDRVPETAAAGKAPIPNDDRTRSVLDRLRDFADEFVARAHDLGLSPSLVLHGREWPPGIEPTGSRLVTCHHDGTHEAHRSAQIGPILLIVARPATSEEVSAEPCHDPRCSLFRREAYLDGNPVRS